MASWFETRGVAALLTMRAVVDLILRGCEAISDLILRSGVFAASRRMKQPRRKKL
jgi:hypothetical protein